MKNIQSYLTFNGNCREAMHFYQHCLGGELYIQTIAETPMGSRFPDNMKNAVLHSSLTKGDMVILGSDMVGQHGLIKGNAVSMVLNCTSEKEVFDCYKSLSEGGEILHEIELTFWGAHFGDLNDRYGNHWFLHYHPDM